jgi:hypothetical protein
LAKATKNLESKKNIENLKKPTYDSIMILYSCGTAIQLKDKITSARVNRGEKCGPLKRQKGK